MTMVTQNTAPLHKVQSRYTKHSPVTQSTVSLKYSLVTQNTAPLYKVQSRYTKENVITVKISLQ